MFCDHEHASGTWLTWRLVTLLGRAIRRFRQLVDLSSRGVVHASIEEFWRSLARRTVRVYFDFFFFPSFKTVEYRRGPRFDLAFPRCASDAHTTRAFRFVAAADRRAHHRESFGKPRAHRRPVTIVSASSRTSRISTRRSRAFFARKRSVRIRRAYVFSSHLLVGFLPDRKRCELVLGIFGTFVDSFLSVQLQTKLRVRETRYICTFSNLYLCETRRTYRFGSTE